MTNLQRIIDKYKLVIISDKCSYKHNVYKTPDPRIYVRDFTPALKSGYIDTKDTETLIFFYSHNQMCAEIMASYQFLLDSKIDAWEYIVTELELQISELK